MSRSAFIIRITSIIFEQCPCSHGITDVRVILVHELRFREYLFRVIDVIPDEEALFPLISNDSFAASHVAPKQDEKLGVLFTLGFFFQFLDGFYLFRHAYHLFFFPVFFSAI